MLLAERSLYAKGRSAPPEVPQKGAGDKWRAAAWELTTSWRATFASAAFGLLVFILVVAGAPIPIASAAPEMLQTGCEPEAGAGCDPGRDPWCTVPLPIGLTAAGLILRFDASKAAAQIPI